MTNIPPITILLSDDHYEKYSPYLMSTMLSNDEGGTAFSQSDVDAIQRDIKMALECLHDNNIHHGSMTEQYIVVMDSVSKHTA